MEEPRLDLNTVYVLKLRSARGVNNQQKVPAFPNTSSATSLSRQCFPTWGIAILFQVCLQLLDGTLILQVQLVAVPQQLCHRYSFHR